MDISRITANLLVRTLSRNGHVVQALHDAFLAVVINLGPPHIRGTAILGQFIKTMAAALRANGDNVVS